jgi:hypothetical protein
MIAANFENLLFLLLVVVAVLFQFLAKTAGRTAKDQAKRTSPPRTPTPIQRAPTESDEDRIRKLLEALGQPPTSRPPPPVVPRTDIPARPLAPVQPPASPLSQLRREKLRKREVVPKQIPPQPLVRDVEEIVPPPITRAPAFEIHEGPLPIGSQAIIAKPVAAYTSIAKDEESKAHIAKLLASPSGLRDAIILREILGAPRGSRMIDLL